MKIFFYFLFSFGLATSLAAQEKDDSPFSTALDRATKQATQQQQFQLRYQFPAGQQFRWSVEHVSTNKTTMAETSEVMSSRTQSTTIWKVIHVDSLGQATLEQTIERVNGWQKNGDQPPVSYDSAKDAMAPIEFELMSKKVGKPLTTILVDDCGATIAGDTESRQYRFGTGSPWVPFPQEPIAVGHRWYAPDEFVAFNEDKSMKRIKLRVQYELIEVQDGCARIRFNTEILTPIEDPKIRSQILQQITHGEMKFDLARGLMLGKKVNWNEKVQGFQGANSLLHYLGEYNVSFVNPTPESDADKPATIVKIKPIKIRTRDDGPVLRR